MFFSFRNRKAVDGSLATLSSAAVGATFVVAHRQHLYHHNVSLCTQLVERTGKPFYAVLLGEKCTFVKFQ